MQGTMKAIVRTNDAKKGGFLADIPIPTPTPNHVIIKVIASPINPSDEYGCLGIFGGVPYEPYVCGNEGAGIITEVGDGVPKTVIGKKVSCWPNFGKSKDKIGMWSQYARLPYNTCVFLEDDQNCEDYCGLFVNPLTLLAFLRIAKEMKVKTIIITAAMSTLAKALIKLCKSEGIDTIGIIRKEEDLKTLLELGAKYALNLKSENFEKELKELAAKTEARMALDAISGEMSNKLAIAMPENSVVYTYGVLSGGKPDLSKIGRASCRERVSAPV